MRKSTFKVYVSLAFLVAGAIIALGDQRPVRLGNALLGAYVGWALFWGLPPFWRWWRCAGPHASLGGRSLSEWAFRLALSIALFVVGAYLFSVLGGGLYQFCAHLWRRRERVATSRHALVRSDPL